jgi:hypothetical protein
VNSVVQNPFPSLLDPVEEPRLAMPTLLRSTEESGQTSLFGEIVLAGCFQAMAARKRRGKNAGSPMNGWERKT